jgi:hypothetical protein
VGDPPRSSADRERGLLTDGRLVDAAHMRLAANVIHKAALNEPNPRQ